MLASEWRFGERKRLCALGYARKKVLGFEVQRVGGFDGTIGGGVVVEQRNADGKLSGVIYVCNGGEESFVRQVYFLDSVPGQGLFDIFIVYSKNDLRYTECSSKCTTLLQHLTRRFLFQCMYTYNVGRYMYLCVHNKYPIRDR